MTRRLRDETMIHGLDSRLESLFGQSPLTDGEVWCLGKRTLNIVTAVHNNDSPSLSPKGIIAIYVGNTLWGKGNTHTWQKLLVGGSLGYKISS